MRIWHEDLPHSVSFRWRPKPQRHLLAFSVVTDWFLTGNWRPHRNKMVRIFKNNKIVISKNCNRKSSHRTEKREHFKQKPYYREIHPMRGLLVSQDPENICKGLEERDDTSLTFFVIFFKKLHRFAKTDYCKYNWSDLWPFWTTKSVGRDSVVRKIAPYPKIEA